MECQRFQFLSSSEVHATVRAEPTVSSVLLRVYIGFNNEKNDPSNKATIHITVKPQEGRSDDDPSQVIPIVLRQYPFLPKHEASNCASVSLVREEDVCAVSHVSWFDFLALFTASDSGKLDPRRRGLQGNAVRARFEGPIDSTWSHQLQSESGFYIIGVDVQKLPKYDRDYSLKIGVTAQGTDFAMKESHDAILRGCLY
jgi:hypothetical protein